MAAGLNYADGFRDEIVYALQSVFVGRRNDFNDGNKPMLRHMPHG